jgi:hypothetical protein
MRSKTEWVIGEGRNGKSAPQKVGLAPEQGKGIEYEFDLLVELTQTHQAVVTKDRTGKFQDETIDRPGEDFGVALYEWLTCGSGEAPVPVPPENPVEKPEPPKQAAAHAFQNEAPNAPPDSKPAEVKAAGNAVIAAIGEILNAVDVAGQRYFSEDEKADARQIVTSVKTGEPGLTELRGFRDFLAGELSKRENTRKAA